MALKWWSALLLWFFVSNAISSRASAFPSVTPWTLVWSDDFSRPGAVNSNKWTFATGNDGFGNHELQAYTRRLTNARVEDGHLVIEARKEHVMGRDYSSARLFSVGHWTYGRFEVRAKLPRGRGTWPAIWMLPADCDEWPDCGEIDIMEHVGYDEGVVHGSFHTKNFNWPAGTQITATRFVPDVTDDFHVYALEWSDGEASMFVDSVKYITFKNPRTNAGDWPFDKDFFLILNIAVGGFWGGAQGIDDSIFPQKMLVDYVRVYQ